MVSPRPREEDHGPVLEEVEVSNDLAIVNCWNRRAILDIRAMNVNSVGDDDHPDLGDVEPSLTQVPKDFVKTTLTAESTLTPGWFATLNLRSSGGALVQLNFGDSLVDDVEFAVKVVFHQVLGDVGQIWVVIVAHRVHFTFMARMSRVARRFERLTIARSFDTSTSSRMGPAAAMFPW
ncbi:hypothetical protein E4U30_001334 [Claviceps sp. LM220 group G6]|nr:hypothetical protein E4U30_001334 [Claviceps sp. LM220 group G6]